jgi:hypothetical protein
MRSHLVPRLLLTLSAPILLFTSRPHAQGFEWCRDIRIDTSSYAYEQGFGILPDSAGSFVIVGASNDRAMIAGCSPEGQVNWSTEITSTQSNSFCRVCRAKDGDLLAVGTFTFFAPSANVDCFYAKYAPSGKTIWSRTFGGTGEDVLTDILVLQDGDAVLLGSSDSAGTRWFIVRVNTDTGDTLWARSVSVVPNFSGTKLLALPNGHFAVLGYGYSPKASGTWLVEFDDSGQPVPDGAVHFADSLLCLRDAVLMDGNSIAGIAYVGGNGVQAITIADPLTGSIEKSIPFAENVELSCVCGSGSHIYVAGRSICYASVADTTWVKCLDLSGTEQWTIKSDIDTSYREITDLKVAPDGDLLGTGWVTVNNGNEKHAIGVLVRVNRANAGGNWHQRPRSGSLDLQSQAASRFDLLGRAIKGCTRKPWHLDISTERREQAKTAVR